MRRNDRKPAVITDAIRSVAVERRSPEVRYVIMMGVRAVCLVVLVTLTRLHVGRAVAVGIGMSGGMAVLPWLAVQTANEPDWRRAPKRRARYLRAGSRQAEAAELPRRPEPLIVDSHTVPYLRRCTRPAPRRRRIVHAGVGEARDFRPWPAVPPGIELWCVSVPRKEIHVNMSAATPTRTPALELRLRGSLGGEMRDCLDAMISAVLRQNAGATARVRVRMTGPDYAGGSVLVQVNLRVCGAAARIQVAAGSATVAIAAAAVRLQRQLRRLTTAWETWAWPDPERPPLASANHGVIARRKNPRLHIARPCQAAAALAAMDYDMHLFTDAETGEDALVYRAGPTGLRLARQRTMRPPSTPATLPMTVNPHTIGVYTAAQAARRLAEGRWPFTFYTDRDTGRGNVLYRRYDGNYGLISPIVTEPTPPQPPVNAGPDTRRDAPRHGEAVTTHHD